jgi:hypothetical protein
MIMKQVSVWLHWMLLIEIVFSIWNLKSDIYVKIFADAKRVQGSGCAFKDKKLIKKWAQSPQNLLARRKASVEASKCIAIQGYITLILLLINTCFSGGIHAAALQRM